ncbi:MULTISPECIES: PDR/VanB family oxidoreductase [Pseudomonadota]|jgi:vanillate O-demethylase ferredoxin subunit|uniref:PDR/VanB family oxidoreductase n=1 Tax=Pseudomonadota TaxID=1224 RepID=UPI00132018C3|nr:MULTISPECIES: PDR/VanB family oxidoreductase [Pseudomonadota]MBP7362409.1 oxidoreductase [Nitrospira sp.]MBP8132423.1 oxidoreductase [Candidatus Hydrogenedentota bacterium]QHE89247.1 oxidoreductase [Hydrogenophaga sp. BPS33]QHE89256.1 oxidoreductase [Hydrogenophaga sp. BPS33]QHE89264.1 oxidoreductase [Hydrogenophaga sp. BPS33]
MKARVHSITYGADDVLIYDIRSADGQQLPPFEAGAHIDVTIPGGIVRSYSLANDPSDRHRYVVGVKREAQGRGGSASMHAHVQAGTLLDIAGPRNNFALEEDAAHSVFIAGGIGITPLWSMAQRLEALRKPWTMYMRGRSRKTTAFLDCLSSPRLGGRVHVSFSEDAGTPRLDIHSIVAKAPKGAHIYCCGPESMLECVESACVHLPKERLHLERFKAKEMQSRDGGYLVRLARSNQEIRIQKGCTILESLRQRGIPVQSSCQQGVCGACETAVLAGRPDHRDCVLSEEERTHGKSMLICCSGSLTEELVLDL